MLERAMLTGSDWLAGLDEASPSPSDEITAAAELEAERRIDCRFSGVSLDAAAAAPAAADAASPVAAAAAENAAPAPATAAAPE